MRKTTRKLIYEYIKKNTATTVTQVVAFSGLSKVRVHAILKYLLEHGYIYKMGSTPKVFYYAIGGVELDITNIEDNYSFVLKNNGKVITSINKNIVFSDRLKFDTAIKTNVAKYIEKNYIEKNIKVKPNQLFNTFSKYAIEANPAYMKAFDVYIMDNFGERDGKDSLDRFYGVFFTILQYTINSKGWLDASIKLNSLEPLYKECDEILHLDAIYYAGIDKVDAHKTKNYEKMELIKEFQDEALIEEYFDSVFLHTFEAFITDKKIDAFLIVPNNVRRQISFNEYIAKHLAKLYPSYPQITVDTKMFAGRKPQKKISGICKRIENATKLFEVDRSTIDESWTKILIIDDVLGSGATVNTLARKVKNVLPNCSICGFAMLGSYRKGFDVVTGI